MKYLWLELYKLKHRKVFLTFLVILGVELLFVFSNYGNNNNFLNMISDPAAPAWEDLIIGPAAINGLFFPILAAVIASRICDMEHKGNTWKLLECNNEPQIYLVLQIYNSIHAYDAGNLHSGIYHYCLW